MGHELTKIERLDRAAKAIAAQRFISRMQVPGICSTLFLLSALVWRPPSPQEYWAAVITGGVTAGVTIMLLLGHRYAILAVVFVYVEMGIALALLTIPGHHTFMERGMFLCGSLVIIYYGFKRFRMGKQFASVFGKGWEEERAQVERWLDLLRRMGKNDNVRQILERTFKKGNLTYRLANTGDCWVMATFKTGQENDLPIDYRVRIPSAITMTEEPGGALCAQMDGHFIPSG
jgi:hypothetical protein